MCGIIGFFGFEDADKLVIEGLSLIKARGLDGVGITDGKTVAIAKDADHLKILKSSCSLGHCLHAMVNNVPQPLAGISSSFVANCEIYNWEGLNKKHKLNARNDAELLFMLLEKSQLDEIPELLDELDGVYAFAYWKKHQIVLARDLIGLKPIWFTLGENLAFCSEKKALINAGLQDIEELNPRTILVYDTVKKEKTLIKRKFFDILPEHNESFEIQVKKVKDLVEDAIKKRIPIQKFGILFSGGLESTIMAFACKQLGMDFTCYTASLKGEKDAPDLAYAKKVAKALQLDLKFTELSLDEVESHIKKVVPLIEDTNLIKVGVGLTIYTACELAKKDKIKVIFSGVGSEELFAGYERHKNSINANDECLSGVRKIYERDLYRDDVITMNNNLELRAPFLDKALTRYSLKIPAKFKINEKFTKVILRDASILMGIPEEFAHRPRKAAQYGSGFDKAIIKLSKMYKFRHRSEYIKQFYPYPNLKLAALISGGKDSWYSANIMKKQNYEISCLVTIDSENTDSYMYHTPNIELVKLQSAASDIPLIIQKTKGEKEKELDDLRIALQDAKEVYKIEGVVSGAIFSNYQRERIEKVCDDLGLKIFSPLWHMDQELEMRNLIEQGFVFLISSIAAEGLDEKWLGKTITSQDVDRLAEISKKTEMNIAGEGGEFESFVTDAPLFKKKVLVKKSHKIQENRCTGRFIIEQAVLVGK